jgi:hypothetical protein
VPGGGRAENAQTYKISVEQSEDLKQSSADVCVCVCVWCVCVCMCVCVYVCVCVCSQTGSAVNQRTFVNTVMSFKVSF